MDLKVKQEISNTFHGYVRLLRLHLRVLGLRVHLLYHEVVGKRCLRNTVYKLEGHKLVVTFKQPHSLNLLGKVVPHVWDLQLWPD